MKTSIKISSLSLGIAMLFTSILPAKADTLTLPVTSTIKGNNPQFQVVPLSHKSNKTKKSEPQMVFHNAQFSFAPFFSTSRYDDDSLPNDLSLNVTVGTVDQVRGFEAAGIMNINKGDVGYCQVAGVGNRVYGNVKGFQAANIFNQCNNVKGTQASGVINTNKKMKGAQLAGIINHNEEMEGFQAAGIGNRNITAGKCQLAGVFNTSRSFRGFQAAGIVNYNDTTYGVQVAGVSNSTPVLKGVQIAGVTNYTGGASEAQISGVSNHTTTSNHIQIAGVINYAETASGAQISGLVNRARFFKGVQIGVINIADSCDGVPIGVLNFVKSGYHKFELSGDDMRFMNLSFRSGVDAFHTILLAGAQADHIGIWNSQMWTLGYGLGFSVPMGKIAKFDTDILYQSLNKGHHYDDYSQLLKLYIGFDIAITKDLSLALGITGNYLMTQKNNPYITSEDVTFYTLNKTSLNDQWTSASWIGAKIGLRIW